MSDLSAAASIPGWGGQAFVRFESAVPNRHGRHPGLFAMLQGLRKSDRLDAEASALAAQMIERSYALHTEPSPDVYAEPGAQGWFRSQVDGEAGVGLRELTRDIIGLLDDHGIVIRTVWTDHPGILTYEDPVQVVAVAAQFPDDWPFDLPREHANTAGGQHDQLQAIALVDDLCQSLGLHVWLRGGWAMDFCLGRITRDHEDIDFFVREDDHLVLVESLVALGWSLDARLPTQRQADLSREGIDLSLNPVRIVDGRPVVGPGPWEGELLPADMLERAGRSALEGVTASYLSPMSQIEFKLMTRVWRPTFAFREKDEMDVALLCRHLFHHEVGQSVDHQ